jgi:hypothetical protein
VWKRLYPDQDAQKLHERLWHSRLVCPGGGQYQWNAQWGTFESTVYGHPGQPKQGPTVPPALSAFARGNFGLTFEHQGLRARVALDRPEDVPQQPAAPAAPDQPPSRTGLHEQHPEIRQALDNAVQQPEEDEAVSESPNQVPHP